MKIEKQKTKHDNNNYNNNKKVIKDQDLNFKIAFMVPSF